MELCNNGIDIDDHNTSRVILINVEQNWAAQIGENAYPAGWMLAP